jgi:putative ABC transport system ATP-binding protein
MRSWPGLLGNAVRGDGTTVVMVTQDPVAAAHADRVVFLADGRIAGELPQPSAEAVAGRMTHLTGRGAPVVSPAMAPAGAEAEPSW